MWIDLKFLYYILKLICVCMCRVCARQDVCMELRGPLLGGNSLSTMWVLEFKLRSSGLVADTFTCQALIGLELHFKLLLSSKF